MDDSELYDLMNEIGDIETILVPEQIALLQAKAIVALGLQINRLGNLLDEMIEPGLTRWDRLRMWLRR